MISLSRFDELRDAEETNYQASIERLGDTATLAEDFVDAYASISSLLRTTKDPPDHLLVVSILFLAARYELERAILDLLRARISDAFQATRRAAELAAFAAKIGRHPHLAEVWMKASAETGTYEEYRRKFGRDLFPEGDDLLNRLGGRYDHGSKQFHGSPYSVATRAGIETRDGSIEFEFRTFDVSNEDPSEPVRSFMWVLDTHFGILKIFVRTFEAQLGTALTAWSVRENALDTKMTIHKQRWEHVIRPPKPSEE